MEFSYIKKYTKVEKSIFRIIKGTFCKKNNLEGFLYVTIRLRGGNMENYNCLTEYEDEDIICKIYRNECNFAEKVPTTQEYIELIQGLKKQERELLAVDGFKKYLETRNVKDAIEAEEQFKLGFKTAVKIIIESYRS